MSWVVWARRDEPRDGDLLSMIRLTDSGGRIVHVGASSGPPLYPGRLLNIRTGGSEEGPRALLARVDPSVRRLELRTHDGGTMDVPLYDCAEIPEVRFAALLLPRELARLRGRVRRQGARTRALRPEVPAGALGGPALGRVLQVGRPRMGYLG